MVERSERFNVGRRIAKRIFFGLVVSELLLVALYASDAAMGGEIELFHLLFNLDGEGNVPAWFSSSQLLMVSLISWLMAVSRDAFTKPRRRFWFATGLVFFILSADETAQIHEGVTGVLGERFIDWVPAYLASNWIGVVAALLLVGLCVKGFARDVLAVWQVSKRTALQFAFGALVYVTGAALCETIGYKVLHNDASLWLYKLEVATEEFFEMFGISIILHALLGFAFVQGKLAFWLKPLCRPPVLRVNGTH